MTCSTRCQEGVFLMDVRFRLLYDKVQAKDRPSIGGAI
jgi:hypothetical protein